MNRYRHAGALSRPLGPLQRNINIPRYSRLVSSSTLRSKLSDLVPPSLSPTFSRDYSPLSDPSDLPIHPQIRTAISLKTLMAANLHLGHHPRDFHRFMLPYVYGERAGVHIINLEHTLVHLRRAINVTREVALRGGNIVFVGTKPSLHRMTVAAAERANGFFVTRWIEGTITNRERVLRRSTGFDPDKISQGTFVAATSGKNTGTGGINEMEEESLMMKSRAGQPHVYIPDLLIVLDMPNNLKAIREANKSNVPIIAICDTDCNPRLVSYAIAANDDSVRGVELIAGLLSLASAEGFRLRKVATAGKWGETKGQK
ncbi:37S ribosomal protein, mitochondrial [Irineochytrium annulatum]|nr:37S ribosomal protein, mitochondrial [Irineochytrium annulatum]